eukprot:Phypoly_transcript_18793.p1 GENE.Phypoly_transcript_18793~~Phypoly_transcript_18793.p1  ORF type:complete len:225 (+),score=35.65 Phypoly_transcript_18793:49-675(+)
MEKDPRAEPKYGERIPYVVVNGGPKSRLMDLVVPPRELINSSNLRLHAIYYITKQIIPSLERVFNLVGADVKSWFAALPREIRVRGYRSKSNPPASYVGTRTIDQYYRSQHCSICDTLVTLPPTEKSAQPICKACRANKQTTTYVVTQQHVTMERQLRQLYETCVSCSGAPLPDIPCISLDCPVYFEKMKLRDLVRSAEECLDNLHKE